MRTSFAVLVVGTALMLAQVVWPLRLDRSGWVSMGRVLPGLVALCPGVLLGLLRGTTRYRAAIVVGLAGSAAMLYGLTPRLSRPIGLPPDPFPNEVIFFVGVAVVAVSFVLGALAILHERRTDRALEP